MAITPHFNKNNLSLTEIIAVCLAGLVVILAGASGIFFLNSFSPLIIGVGVLVFLVLFFWFKKPIWALYCAIFIVFLPLGLIPSETHSTLNRAITVSAFSVWLLYIVFKRRKIILTPAAVFMLGFLVWGILSLSWTGDFKVSLNAIQIYSLRCALYMILMANLLRTKQDLDGLMWVLAVNGWILMALFLWTLATAGYTPGSRIKILGMNENEAAIFCLVAMPGVFWKGLQSENGLRSLRMWLALLYLGLSVGLITMSGSRGGIISLVAVLLGFMFFKRTRIFSVLGLVILIVGYLIVPDIYTTIISRMGGEGGDTLLGGREAFWKAAWMIILNNFWAGVGIGFSPEALVGIVRAYTSIYYFESVAIHNPPLVIWAETGIIGIFLYLGVLASALITFIRGAWSSRRNPKKWAGLYYSLIIPISMGYLLSWIKGGGAESEFTYFFMMALMLFPIYEASKDEAASLTEFPKNQSI